MRIKLMSLCALTALLFSCQKEISIDTSTTGGSNTGGGNGGSGNGGSGGGSTSGSLLIKSVGINGNDSSVTTYTYDAQGRVSTMINDDTQTGSTIHSYKKYEYDNAGRVAKITQTDVQFGSSNDTAINIIHYPNATAMEMDYAVNTLTMNFMGLPLTTVDSSLFTYSNGKISSVSTYMNNSLTGTGYYLSSKNDFVYDATGRVATLKLYGSNTPGAPLSSMGDEQFTYGTSLNAVWLPNNIAQKYWIGGLPNATNHAVTRMQVVNSPSQANGMTLTITYVMGSNGLPMTSVNVESGGGQPTRTMNYTYYYR
jgi:YD repeat-containing protein